MANTKYHPYTPCGSQGFCCPGFSCIMTLAPGDKRGVFLNPPPPSNVICAKSFGFDIAGLIIFNVTWACLRRRHHSCIGNIFPTPHSPAMKWFFHMQMYCSAAFILFICEGTNWNASDFFLSKVLIASEALLSSQCVDSFNPLLAISQLKFCRRV